MTSVADAFSTVNAASAAARINALEQLFSNQTTQLTTITKQLAALVEVPCRDCSEEAGMGRL
jgi:hypothetical protein